MQIEDVYPLSPLQEGLYYHWLSDQGSAAYCMQMSYRLKGRLDIGLLKESYQRLVERHAILRTFFTQDFGDSLLQVVKTKTTGHFSCQQLAGGDVEQQVSEYKKIDRAKGFDLHAASVMRVTVIELEDDSYEFIWSHHHILMDGWCISILIREFFQIYYALLQKQEPGLPKLFPYSNYIKWLQANNKKSSLAYWQQYLSDYSSTISLAPPKANNTGRSKKQQRAFEITENVRRGITELCSLEGITESVFMQAVWAVLLGKYNNTGDVVFGAVVSGRPAEVEGVEQMIGLFSNTIPVRIHWEKGTTMKELLKQVKAGALESMEHHYVQLAEIQSQVQGGRELFDHILVFENYPVQEMIAEGIRHAYNADSLSLISSASFDQTNYNFTCAVMPGDKLKIRYTYDEDIFEEQQVIRLEKHLLKIIDQTLKEPASVIDEIEYLTDDEREQLLYGFNNTGVFDPAGKTVVSLFEEQVQRTPGNVAIECEGRLLTYKDLNEKANRLAGYLRESFRIQPDDLIALKLDRNEWMLIAIMGVLKSGAAYVPIDVDYPVERVNYMVADCNAKVLIDEVALNEFRLHEDLYDPANDVAIVQPHHLAYVIYTSGTTGRAKGVMIEHRNVCARMEYLINHYAITAEDNLIFYRSYSFDAAIEEYLLPLMKGARCVVAPPTLKDDLVQNVVDLIDRHRITKINMPPVLLGEIVQLYDTALSHRLSSLRHVVSGGDRLTMKIVNDFLSRSKATLHNAYGPTENTDDSTNWQAEQRSINDPVPIGHSIRYSYSYILDDNFYPVPVGVSGELYVSGAGVARGYLHNSALTAERFLPDPFRAGERMYRTGDICRWLSDGTIEFIGRKDDQVKIRGYRIEPAEIEAALLSHRWVGSAVVTTTVGSDQQKELMAYVVSAEPLQPADLRSHLAGLLPSYMIPVHYVQLDKLPLTPNGKIDKKQLPDPATAGMRNEEKYLAPGNENEEAMVAIWQKLLGRERISINDNFFDVGGNSIKIMSLSRLASDVLKKEISVALLFQYPTIKDLVSYVEQTPTVAEVDAMDRGTLINELENFNTLYDGIENKI